MCDEHEDEITSILGKSFQTSKKCSILEHKKHSKLGMTKRIPERTSQCAICLENMRFYFITPCGHHFCEGCFDDWYVSTDSMKKCPVCRQHVSLDEILMNGKAHSFNIKRNSKFEKYTKPIRIVESGSANTNVMGFGASSFHSSDSEQFTPTTVIFIIFFLAILTYGFFYRYG